MTWGDIATNFPKSFALAGGLIYEPHALYEFFIKQGLWLYIPAFPPFNKHVSYGWVIAAAKKRHTGIYRVKMKDRREAEARGFYKCFQILEDRINPGRKWETRLLCPFVRPTGLRHQLFSLVIS